jgi:hypothetical protein
MHSINKTARVAGFLYLMVVPLGIFGTLYVPSKLIARGGAGFIQSVQTREQKYGLADGHPRATRRSE